MTSIAPLTIVSKSVKINATADYLRFAYSAQHNTLYAIGEDFEGNKGIYVYAVGGDAGSVVYVPCLKAIGPIAIDESLGVVYVASSDGTLAMRVLGSEGIPATTGEDLPTGLARIETVCINPITHQIYVLGPAGGRAISAESSIVSIPIDNTFEAILIPEFRRLYACSAYSGHHNVCVWTLESNGRPSDPMPVRYSDGLLADSDHRRGILFTIRVDKSRRKLYVGGWSSEPLKHGTGAVVVYDLDGYGNPIGSPRPYPSDNSSGAVSAIELSPDGKWLYEAGWGDPKVFAWRLDPWGEPEGRPEPGAIGAQGKKQLQITADGLHLLAGTYPSILEIIDLTRGGETVRGTHAYLEIGNPVVTRREDLGLLVPGGPPSEWVDMDASLRDRAGLELARLALPNYPASVEVTHAIAQVDVAQAVGEEMKPLKSFVVYLTGNAAAIILPCYGIDDVTALTSLVQSSTERYAQHFAQSAVVAIPFHERPTQFVVANGLIGIDSNPEAVRAGVQAIGMLGHNTIQVWNFPGMSPATIRTAAAAANIYRFRWAVYNPPAYFDFYTDALQPDKLAEWANGFRTDLATMGADVSVLSLFHMADEPGWYFPYISDKVREQVDRLAVFRGYLRAKGLTPDLLGHATWETVSPIGLSAAGGAGASLGTKRLLFWSARFFAESVSNAFAAATAALLQQLNPELLVTTNLNNWPGRYFIPSPNKKIGNNPDTGPDAAMGMPDWFDLARKRAVSCLWTEDWFGDEDAQLWSLYGDLLRSAAREGDLSYGGYIVGQSMSVFNIRDGPTYKIMALVAHGAKALDMYVFGEILAFGDSWSENYHVYRPLSDALRLLAQGEPLLYVGRPRTGTVAILLPQASQVWDPDADERYYIRELYGLHAALIHAQYPVDFIDDFSVENDALHAYGYTVLYVSAPNLSTRAQEAILRWVREGGTLVLLPGACAADEYDQPTEILAAAIGAMRPTVTREPVPPRHTAQARIRQVVTRADDQFPVSLTSTFYQIAGLAPVTGAGRALANFSDGSTAAVVVSEVDRGRVITFGYWPGTTYWYSPDRSNRSRLPNGWSLDTGAIITMSAEVASAQRHVSVSARGVEAALLESDKGVAVTLLNWFSTPLESLTVTVHRTQAHVAEIRSLRSGVLGYEVRANDLHVMLPRLETVDVIMVFYWP